ncbi:MAG: 2-C-methyl-D-erythritol 2,4-cyclodiphosphate synthase [Lachnospiraceae bacterium]|nr:2-C-methyl-D-erythritol 2,4-cyclodiphosphate synthase [Lachnospiraceae bacterium]
MMRVGQGYDVHKLTEGRPLIIGGVKIDYEKGLEGHSDADVLVHAIMDALLGAASLGDIGALFPDNDDQYLGADSICLLQEVGKVLKEYGYSVGNIDSTIIAQAPKMRNYIDQMRERIAKALGIDMAMVSVKATTEEGMGFTGRKEGIAAFAICLIQSL